MTSEEYLENLIDRVNSKPDDSLRTMNSEMIGLILLAGRMGDLQDVEELMSRIDVSKASPISVASLLRCSLRFLPHLRNWIPLRDRLMIALKNYEGIDSKSLMLNLDTIDVTYQPPTELDGLMRVHPNFRK